MLSGQDFTDWRDISRVLGAAGYHVEVANVAIGSVQAALLLST